MRHDWTLRRQTNTSAARADALEECGGSILYLDEQHLTRDCVSRELARRLPEYTIIERATAQDLAPGDPTLAKIAVIILYVHADRMNLHADQGGSNHNGIAAQLSILEDVAPAIPRVIMSGIEVPEDILDAFRRHIRGYVPTTLPIKQVAEAIRFVAAGGTFVPQSILSLHDRAELAQESSHNFLGSEELADFSPRQNEVLRMLWNGSSNKVIAYELRMSESTVKVHIRHIMRKLNVNNRTQVVLRTRPQQLDKQLQASPKGLSCAVRTPAVLPAVPDGRPMLAQTNGRSPDLSKDAGVHGNSHRS